MKKMDLNIMFKWKMRTTNTKINLKIKFLILLIGLLGLASIANATVRLLDDWPSGFTTDGHPIPDDQFEPSRLRHATEKLADFLKATPIGPHEIKTGYQPGFKLFIDNVKYYIDSATFMARSHPEEICHPDYKKALSYKCEEGQALTRHPHIFFFNNKFEPVGVYQLKLNLPYQYFCNSMPALGVADKTHNELLVTVQCFDINAKPASKRSELGSGWQRMTLLFRVRVVEGKVELEQDDTCLGNPNQYEDIPTARKALKKCAAGR
jgi:hypothetical protein